jgi:hypothetical protein
MENFQRVKSFDDVTILKIKKSAFIALGGLLVIAVPFLANELVDMLQTGNALDWRSLFVMVITASATWIVNTVREYWIGETK